MTDPTPPTPRRDIDLDAFVRLLRREWVVVVAFLGAVAIAAAIATALTPRRYRAVAVVQLLPRAGQEVEVKEVVRNDDGGYMESRERARTHLQLMTSRGVREEVVKAYNKLGYDDFDPSPESLDALGKLISAAPREDTQLVEIAVLHTDPERAATLANLLADLYCTSNLVARTDAARETQGWLGGQADVARTALDDATAGLMAFKEANDLVDADEKVDGITSQLASLQKALGETTARRVLLEGNVHEHRRLLEKREFDVLAGMFTDPALDAMIKDRAKVLTETSDVLSRYGDQHPEHQQAVERIKRIEALIAVEVQRNVDAEASEAQSLRRQEDEIGGELDRVKAELMDKQRLMAQYDTLKAEAERARWLNSALAQRSAEVELQANSRLNDVRVVDHAVPPTRPTTPNVLLNFAVAIAIGLGGGVGLVLVKQRLVDQLWDPDDVESALGAPLLGVLPRLELSTLQERAFHGHHHPRSHTTEAARWIRSLLLATRDAQGRRCLLVTSCEAEEGKTHAAVQLAVSYAQSGSSVLLVDCDLRCPQVHEVFEVARAPGLSDAIGGEVGAQAFLVGTIVPNLDILPCGAPIEAADEFISGPELRLLLTALRTRYDVVILDSPPASVVADALSLAAQADGVVLVIRQGRVTRTLARKTIDRLRQVGGRVAGVVMNDVPQPKRQSKYYDDRPAVVPPPLS